MTCIGEISNPVDFPEIRMPQAATRSVHWRVARKHRLFDLFMCFVHLIQEMVLHGEEGGCCSRRDADFAINVLNMMVDGVRGDREEGCHLAVGVSTGDEPEHLDLAVTQPCHPCMTCGT